MYLEWKGLMNMFYDNGIDIPRGTIAFGSRAVLEKYDEKSEGFPIQKSVSSSEEYEQALKDFQREYGESKFSFF